MQDMAENMGVGTGVRELKIGQSFLSQRKGNAKSKSSNSRKGTTNQLQNGENISEDESYHTIRYDFKPASSNTSSTGFLEVDEDNRVSVKIPHEGGGQTNFGGHQKESNAKDCLLIIDHVTGEITLEKLSSQLMVKKTRAEKLDGKGPQDGSLNISAPSSRPHTPTHMSKQEDRKSDPQKRTALQKKKTGVVNNGSSSAQSKHSSNLHDSNSSSKQNKKGDNLSSDSSSDISSDSDSDSSSKLKQGNNVNKESMHPSTSGVAGKNAGSMQSSSAASEASNIKNYNHSSPSNSRVSSARQKPIADPRQQTDMQSTFNTINGPARLSDLNDEFDDSDDSDNEISNIRQDNEQDFSLSMFASNGSMQTGRNAPNLSQYHSKSASPPIRDQMNFNQSHHSKPTSNPSAISTSIIPSMPEFLNDDLELSESDSDS